MPQEERIFGGRWRVVRELGKGGQGVVYEVDDTSGSPSKLDSALLLKKALKDATAVVYHQDDLEPFIALTEVLRRLPASDSLPKAALKELLPIDEAVNAANAATRMKAELEALKAVSHPGLIKVLHDRLEQNWFVMEFFPDGPLSRQPGRFKGRVLDSLEAFRTIVDATAALHKNKIVHRDIKPENVFVRADGSLVLGDCGLAIKMANQERLTMTYENVGTRDYQPPWTYAMRLEDVKPNFDVFGLAKLLWAMISGRPRFPLEDFDVAPHDLRGMFPNDPDVLFVHRIFKQCIVRREPQCTIPDASKLLEEVDEAIHALTAGGQVPNATGKMRCRFCGIGRYDKISNFQATGSSSIGQYSSFYTCDHCGHLEAFVRLGNKTPPAWSD